MVRTPPIPCPEEWARLGEWLEQTASAAARPASERFSCGCAALDALLPGGGLPRGALVEWLADGPAGGASLLAVVAAREAHRAGGAVVAVDADAGFYPPAAAACGLDLAGTILVHPRNETDQRWALDQALRCQHAAAVIAWPRRLDGRTFRRLQLAAEASGSVGLLVRPAAARREPSWAHVRWTVTPRAAPAGGWRLALRLLRVRGVLSRGLTGTPAEIVVEIDPLSGAIHEARLSDLAPELAHPAVGAQPA